jgi:hypothetical protein
MDTDAHGYFASQPSVFIRVHPWFRWIFNATALGADVILTPCQEEVRYNFKNPELRLRYLIFRRRL